MYKIAPLPGTFMLTAILGFLISTIGIASISTKWGFAFSLVFVFMFLASVISMTRADVEEELAMDEGHYKKRKK